MYSESDIDGAVTAGAITREAANALRDHIAANHSTPAVDEEHFRLLTGCNVIFESSAAAAVLGVMAWLGESIWLPLAGALVAATSWGLAEYFTRQRRMARPSILLLLAFIGGVAAAQVGVVVVNADALQAWGKANFPDHFEPVIGTLAALIAVVTAGAAWLHWRRIMVTLTVG